MRLVVVSHALVQEGSWARWRRLAERHPVEVHLLVPSRWENAWFGQRTVWRPGVVLEGRFAVQPLPVVHHCSWGTYLFASLDARLRRLRPDVIYCVQEELTLVLQQMILYRGLWAARSRLAFFSWNNLGVAGSRWWQRAFWGRTCEGTDMAIAGNSEVVGVLRRAGYTKPIAVQTEIGVDENVFFPDPARGRLRRATLGLHGFVVGFAGRLTEAKGILDLVDASLQLPGDWQLLLVGDGELRPGIEARFASLGKPDRLRCTGQVKLDEMPDLLRAMDCLVLPPRTTPAWKEQFGLVLAQAMACGVPVIGSDSGAIPGVIADAGLIFPEGDASVLRAALQRLMSDEGLRQDLAQRALKRCLGKYSATALANETYETFTRLLDGNFRWADKSPEQEGR